MKVIVFRILILFLILGAHEIFAATIHGFVREKATKEPVIMGNVWIKDTTIGTTTNMKGYYVLSGLEPGTYEIYFRYMGYKTEVVKQTISVNQDIEVSTMLEEEVLAGEDVVVTAEREKRELDIKPGQIVMPTTTLRKVPQVAEPDLFRAMQMLPGVATLSDFSAGLYVRGGSADQNLILLDNIDVYNPNHLFGFFSSFNTDAIKSAELLKGGFPAMYGGRLSSVLNVINKEGNRENFQGTARLSLLSSMATIEGPWEHGSWMLAGRRTYIDLAAKVSGLDDIPDYYFYDGHGKINYDIDRNNQASFSFYVGQDKLKFEAGQMDGSLVWGNKTFSAQWMHLFSSNLYSQFVFAGSRFDSDTEISLDDNKFGFYNEVTDLALKGWLTYTPSTKHSFDVGFEAKMVDFDLNNEVVDLKAYNSYTGNYLSGYIQDNYKLGLVDIIQAGFRLDYYSDGNYVNTNPRFSWKHLMNEKIHTTLSYGQFSQFLNSVQEEGMSFSDMWIPVDETVDGGKAEHFIFGITYDNHTSFSLEFEAYYKRFINLAEFKPWESRPADEDFNDQTAADNFLMGKGRAYGADVYLRNNIWGFEGWLGYSLCWTKKKVDGYNFDREYYPTYDRRHTITAIQDYHITRKWRVNFAFKYGSGQPYTEATARYTGQNPNGTTFPVALTGEKNVYRLPAYHRLDIGTFYDTRIFGLDSEIYLQVINVYNYKNVWLRNWNTTLNPAVQEDVGMLPILPTAGISIKF